MPVKSLIACILIRVRLRGCKAIDFILDLHCFGSYNFVCMFGWNMFKCTCTHMHTHVHTNKHRRLSNYQVVVINQIVGSSQHQCTATKSQVLVQCHSEILIYWLHYAMTLKMKCFTWKCNHWNTNMFPVNFWSILCARKLLPSVLFVDKYSYTYIETVIMLHSHNLSCCSV